MYSIIQLSWVNIKTKTKSLAPSRYNSLTHIMASLAGFSFSKNKVHYRPLIYSSNMATLKRLLPRTPMTKTRGHNSDFIAFISHVAFDSLDHSVLLEFSFPSTSLTVCFRLFSFLTGCSSVFSPRICCLICLLDVFLPGILLYRWARDGTCALNLFKWSSYCRLLQSRLRLSARSQTTPNSNSHTSNCFKCSPNKCIFG